MAQIGKPLRRVYTTPKPIAAPVPVPVPSAPEPVKVPVGRSAP